MTSPLHEAKEASNEGLIKGIGTDPPMAPEAIDLSWHPITNQQVIFTHSNFGVSLHWDSIWGNTRIPAFGPLAIQLKQANKK